jgi:hypothetical protein
MEWQQETCRGGRLLITAINRRAGHAMYLDPSELAEVTGAHFDQSNETNTDVCKQPGAGLVWNGVDRFVRCAHDVALHRVFRRGFVVGQIAVGLAGALAVWSVVFGGRVELRAQPMQIPMIVALGLVAVAVHELAHALVTVHYGRSIRAAGLRLHLGSPAFYVESLDALLLSRRQRIVQAAAGPWAEWLATSCAAFVLLTLNPHTAMALILHRFVIVNTITIASNLIPFVGLDGALIFADIIREPDLAFRARASISSRRELARGDRWLVAYAIANSLVALALVGIAVFFWWQLFGGVVALLVGLGPIGVAVLVVLASLLSRQVLRSLAGAASAAAPYVASARSKIAFRLERHWRVRAIKQFRVLPEVAVLDVAALGVVAGRLERVCVRGRIPACGEYVYLRPGLRDAISRPRTACRGEVRQWARTDDLSLKATAVVLPHGWQHFVAQTA